MKINHRNLIFLISAAFVMMLSILGPEALARYQDGRILGESHAQSAETAGEGYRYTLNANEKLYILSACLSSQSLPGSERNSLTSAGVAYQEPEGSYAFVQSYRGPSDGEITGEEIYKTCNEGLAVLKERGILPDAVRAVDAAAYEATLYSAIDVLEPENNVAVWKVSLSDSLQNTDRENRVMDVYIDADSGKIYEVYARTSLLCEDMDPDAIVNAWREYLGLGAPTVYESDNPLLETTPYFKKYVFAGMGDGITVVTVGLYEGINEFFIKISR